MDAGTLVKRMKVTLPLIKALSVDQGLTNLLLNHLIASATKAGATITLPEGAKHEVIPADLFESERRLHAQSSLDNAAAVRLEIDRNRRRYIQREKERKARGKKTAPGGSSSRLAHVVNYFVQALDQAIDSQADKAPSPALLGAALTDRRQDLWNVALPKWVTPGAEDHRDLVRTTPEQYVALVQLHTAVLKVICDSGCSRSCLDLASAQKMRLPIDTSPCGTYFGPGSQELSYTGRVMGPVELRFSDEVKLSLPFLYLISHHEPLFLLGTDVLCGGLQGWAFRWMGVGSDD